MVTEYVRLESPVGELTISTDGAYITGLHIAGDRYFTAIPGDWLASPRQPLLKAAGRQLQEYFAGQRRDFELPVVAAGTPFQQAVWAALRQIPAGSTATYAEVAAIIGRPAATRAVGTAIGRNPVCIIVPCHRVLASGGSLGGYVAGFACKQQLLRLEGALT